MSAVHEIAARRLVAGTAHGKSAVLQAPLSLWGGFDPDSGRIIDVHHPQHGAPIAGRIVVMPGGRGSSSSASVLLESVRLGHHPLALVLVDPDPVLVIAALVAGDLYGVAVPVVQVAATELETLPDGVMMRVEAGEQAATIVFD